jgi:6-phosphofructokinase 1
MNAAVRAIVRHAIKRGAEPYAIFEGYTGMYNGGSYIRRLYWDDVSGFLEKGGTLIGTSRCAEFRTREGRKKAALNLLSVGIDRFICIGGDGSLTGADILSREWPEFVQELLKEGKISAETAERHKHLHIVGMVGSIDNDMCGTDMTIGANTALHRIVECLDAIFTTAASHQRTFVVEVMGRNCGFLAVSACLATGSDWVLIPELPADDDWRQKMCRAVQKGRERGRRLSMIIVAEGARDTKGNPITANEVKNVIEKELNYEVRITILGHIQRGGTPSAYDRIISTLMGIEAVNAVLESTPGTEPVMIGIKGNQIVRSPLMECVRQTQSVAVAIQNGEYERALHLRGADFMNALSTLMTLTRSAPHKILSESTTRPAFLVMHVGAPAPGMNAAVRACVRLALDKGYRMLAAYNGFKSILENIDEIEELNWFSVNGWANLGGALLGTNRSFPKTNDDLKLIANAFRKHNVRGLMMIGGWEGYSGCIKMYESRTAFPEFNIPIVCIPATISNNLPGTDFSIGCDTALNAIVEAADKVKLSAVASRARVFIMEVMGGACGYLALHGAIAGGAQIAYLPEKGIRLQDLVQDIERLKGRFRHCKTTSLVINNENASPTYNTEMLSKIFAEEGQGYFDVRHLILGHIQQGYSPSPLDRLRGAVYGRAAVDWVIEQTEKSLTEAGAIGLIGAKMTFTPFQELIKNMDQKYRRPKIQTWEKLMVHLENLRSRPEQDVTYRPFSYHLRNVYPGRATMPSVNDAAYHFRVSAKQTNPSSESSGPQQPPEK